MTQSKSSGTRNQNKSQSRNQQSGKPGTLSEAEPAQKAGGNLDTKSSGEHMSGKNAGSEQGTGGGAKQEQHRS